MKALFVGGTVDNGVGRPSGYISRMASIATSIFPSCHIHNGGNVRDLDVLAAGAGFFDCIFWMCDVDNSHDKFLPSIKKTHPGVFLIQSKFNGGRYTDADLYARMQDVAL